VSLADKLDTISGFFAVDEKPTGSKDPFALRRAALGIASLILDNSLRFDALRVLQRADFPFAEMQPGASVAFEQVMTFLIDRLKVQQREAGVRHDLIDAVFALGGEDDLVRLLARVKALQAFVATDDGTNLLAGYKRAANILKKEEFETAAAADKLSLTYTPESEEADLLAALETAEQAAGEAVAEERFEGAMAALATLRAPIDAFFDKVTVNDADPDKRHARLTMLARVRSACNNVADFSKIEG
jgi:glycyl-tRNA synthetase beta chain